MELTIILKQNELLKVKAKRVFKNTFPKLELYLHKTPAKKKDGTSNFNSMWWGVSDISGIGISNKCYFYPSEALRSAKRVIEMFGEDRVLQEVHKVINKNKEGLA